MVIIKRTIYQIKNMMNDEFILSPNLVVLPLKTTNIVDILIFLN